MTSHFPIQCNEPVFPYLRLSASFPKRHRHSPCIASPLRSTANWVNWGSWIDNLIDRRLERFQQSDGCAYREQTCSALDETVELELAGMRYSLKITELFSMDE